MNYSLKAYLSHDKWPLMKYSMKRKSLEALSFQWLKRRHGLWGIEIQAFFPHENLLSVKLRNFVIRVRFFRG